MREAGKPVSFFVVIWTLFWALGNVGSVSAQMWKDITIHGFVSQGYMQSTDNNYLMETEDGSFQFNEIGINFTTVYEKLRLGMQIFSRDLGDQGNNEVTIDWAVADYYFNDYAGIRAGKVKLPLGLYNQSRDVDMLRTPIILPGSSYDEGFREIASACYGVDLYGNIDMKIAGDVDYELFYGTNNVESDSLYVRGFMERMNRGSQTAALPLDQSEPDQNIDYLAGAALRWNNILEGLRLGAHMFIFDAGANSEFTDPSSGFTVAKMESEVEDGYATVFSLEYKWMDFTFASEITHIKVETAAKFIPLSPQLPFGPVSRITSSTSLGWYIQMNYRFSDLVKLGVYYSEFYPDDEDKDGEKLIRMGLPDYLAWQKEIVPTVRFDINRNWLVKLETHFVDGAANVYEFNNPEGREDDWILYAAKVTFNF